MVVNLLMLYNATLASNWTHNNNNKWSCGERDRFVHKKPITLLSLIGAWWRKESLNTREAFMQIKFTG
jgi:hypothetical protein